MLPLLNRSALADLQEAVRHSALSLQQSDEFVYHSIIRLTTLWFRVSQDAALDLQATVKEMEDGGYLKKTTSDRDGRITYLSITEAGRALSQTYNARFFAQLRPLLADIPEEDAECTIRTIEAFYQVMCERRNSLEKR